MRLRQTASPVFAAGIALAQTPPGPRRRHRSDRLIPTQHAAVESEPSLGRTRRNHAPGNKKEFRVNR